MIDINELRKLAQAALVAPDGLSAEWTDRLGQFQESVSPTAIIELLDRLEAAEKKSAATMMLADRLALALNTSNHELDALRAKIEAMEKQEPHSYIYRYWNPMDGSPVWRHEPRNWNGQQPSACAPLYALPGAKGE